MEDPPQKPPALLAHIAGDAWFGKKCAITEPTSLQSIVFALLVVALQLAAGYARLQWLKEEDRQGQKPFQGSPEIASEDGVLV